MGHPLVPLHNLPLHTNASFLKRIFPQCNYSKFVIPTEAKWRDDKFGDLEASAGGPALWLSRYAIDPPRLR